ncbi:hypothetical protein QAD02_018412 [Eretmocerus hayati]|uniref:Uncharacterized protein n=1 Tax=Eretmocerus hayati TaxID=131215 RepID=A0ACC2PLG7_9HYME|nr:hypothetical protein QAD02_018412 [Eretmocerus hayati]
MPTCRISLKTRIQGSNSEYSRKTPTDPWLELNHLELEATPSTIKTHSITPEREEVLASGFARAAGQNGDNSNLPDSLVSSSTDGDKTPSNSPSDTNRNSNSMELGSPMTSGADTNITQEDDESTDTNTAESGMDSDPIPGEEKSSCDSSIRSDDSEVDETCSRTSVASTVIESDSDQDEDSIDGDTETTDSQKSVSASDIPFFENSPHNLEYAMPVLTEWFVQSKTSKKWMDALVKIFKELLPQENTFPDKWIYVLQNFQSEFDIAKQIKFLFEHRNLAKLLGSRPKSHRNQGLICDINDGSEFFRANDEAFEEKGPYDMVLVSFLDGSNYSNSSNANVWPYYYTIADLPEHLRNSFITVGSIWADDIKPKMNTWMAPRCIKIKENSTEGITWTHPEAGVEHTSRVIAPEFIADKPARSELLNQMHGNSRYACETCEIRTVRNSAVPGKKRKRIYPFLEREVQTPAKEPTNQRINVKGLTSVPVISMLPGLDPSTCMFPECLHALCLGGGKTILGVKFTTLPAGMPRCKSGIKPLPITKDLILAALLRHSQNCRVNFWELFQFLRNAKKSDKIWTELCTIILPSAYKEKAISEYTDKCRLNFAYNEEWIRDELQKLKKGENESEHSRDDTSEDSSSIQDVAERDLSDVDSFKASSESDSHSLNETAEHVLPVLDNSRAPSESGSNAVLEQHSTWTEDSECSREYLSTDDRVTSVPSSLEHQSASEEQPICDKIEIESFPQKPLNESAESLNLAFGKEGARSSQSSQDSFIEAPPLIIPKNFWEKFAPSNGGRKLTHG